MVSSGVYFILLCLMATERVSVSFNLVSLLLTRVFDITIKKAKFYSYGIDDRLLSQTLS